MSEEIIFIVEESEDGGYEAKALGFSIYTEAETFDELRKLFVMLSNVTLKNPNYLSQSTSIMSFQRRLESRRI